MMVFKSEPSGFADSMRPAPGSRKKIPLNLGAFRLCVYRCGSYRLKTNLRTLGLRISFIVVRPPEPREVPAEVQFEVAPNTVSDITNLGTARLRAGPGQE